MISIFRDGYGILPSTILVPHLNAYQSDKHLHDNTDIELSKNQPNLILTDDNIILKNQDKLSDDSLAYTHEIFKKLFKKNDDTQEINSTDTTNIFVQTFSQLAEKRIYKQIETDYYNFLTIKQTFF